MHDVDDSPGRTAYDQQRCFLCGNPLESSGACSTCEGEHARLRELQRDLRRLRLAALVAKVAAAVVAVGLVAAALRVIGGLAR